MSKAEILAELPRLNPEERQEVLEKIVQLDQLAGDEWLADANLAEFEKAMLNARLAAYQASPHAGNSWEEVEARMQTRLKQ